jgi:hypothetical protein
MFNTHQLGIIGVITYEKIGFDQNELHLRTFPAVKVCRESISW